MAEALGCGWRNEDSNPSLDMCVSDIIIMAYYKLIEPDFILFLQWNYMFNVTLDSFVV
jgi:hypothetical protein